MVFEANAVEAPAESAAPASTIVTALANLVFVIVFSHFYKITYPARCLLSTAVINETLGPFIDELRRRQPGHLG